MAEAPLEASEIVPLLSLGLDEKTWGLVLQANLPLLVIVVLIGAVMLLIFRRSLWHRIQQLDIDETELGIGSAKLKLKPNNLDRQVAYQVWVELSTRKIGLPIDLEHDVIADIYESWHAFFGVTRELIKSVPVTKASTESTRQIINLSIDVLNLGLRPHLTRWQARFRAWYERQLRADLDEEPQDIQQRFPNYTELSADMQNVNKRLMTYRTAMQQIVYGSDATAREAIEVAKDVVGRPKAD